MSEDKGEYLIEVTEESLMRKAQEYNLLRQLQGHYNMPSLCNINVSNLEITSANQYFELIEMIPADQLEDYIDQHWHEYSMIQDIIALEVALYSVSRVSNICGSNSDAIRRLITEKVFEYEKEFKKSYKDPNRKCKF